MYATYSENFDGTMYANNFALNPNIYAIFNYILSKFYIVFIEN